MAQRFVGQHRFKLDGKGRVSLPGKYRGVFEAEGASALIVLPQAEIDTAHTVYTPAGYDEMMDDLEAQYPPDHPQFDLVNELYVARAQELAIDSAGRFVIPADLRDALFLTGEVLFVGNRRNFQLWHPEAREVHSRSILGDAPSSRPRPIPRPAVRRDG